MKRLLVVDCDAVQEGAEIWRGVIVLDYDGDAMSAMMEDTQSNHEDAQEQAELAFERVFKNLEAAFEQNPQFRGVDANVLTVAVPQPTEGDMKATD